MNSTSQKLQASLHAGQQKRVALIEQQDRLLNSLSKQRETQRHAEQDVLKLQQKLWDAEKRLRDAITETAERMTAVAASLASLELVQGALDADRNSLRRNQFDWQPGVHILDQPGISCEPLQRICNPQNRVSTSALRPAGGALEGSGPPLPSAPEQQQKQQQAQRLTQRRASQQDPVLLSVSRVSGPRLAGQQLATTSALLRGRAAVADQTTLKSAERLGDPTFS